MPTARKERAIRALRPLAGNDSVRTDGTARQSIPEIPNVTMTRRGAVTLQVRSALTS